MSTTPFSKFFVCRFLLLSVVGIALFCVAFYFLVGVHGNEGITTPQTSMFPHSK